MITLENLYKSFGSHLILNDISFSLFKGSVTGIVGVNGSGKTTLFRCIAGFEKYSGTITSEKNPLKNHLGFLPTDPFFIQKITGREYLILHGNAREIKMTDIDTKNIFELPLDQYASTYSTGMKKKLAMTAILIQNNDYYIFDEPFNGIDLYGSLMIAEIIRKLKETGKTIFISSHIFSTLVDTCDEIMLLENGRISEKASKPEFHLLEQKMTDITLHDKIEKLFHIL